MANFFACRARKTIDVHLYDSIYGSMIRMIESLMLLVDIFFKQHWLIQKENEHFRNFNYIDSKFATAGWLDAPNKFQKLAVSNIWRIQSISGYVLSTVQIGLIKFPISLTSPVKALFSKGLSPKVFLNHVDVKLWD